MKIIMVLTLLLLNSLTYVFANEITGTVKAYKDALDSLSTFVENEVKSHRRLIRTSMLRSEIFVTAEGSQVTASPIKLLCEPITEHIEFLATLVPQKMINKEISNILADTEDEGIMLLIYAITNDYESEIPSTSSLDNLNQEVKVKCETDFKNANDNLFYTAGQKEISIISAVGVVTKVIDTLDKMTGTIGSVINSKKQSNALKKYLNDTKDLFNKSLDDLEKNLVERNGIQRLISAEDYLITYDDYYVKLSSITNDKDYPTNSKKIQKSKYLLATMNKDIERLLKAADNYDSFFDVDIKTALKSIKSAHSKLIKYANDESISFVDVKKSLETTKKIFDELKTGIEKLGEAKENL